MIDGAYGAIVVRRGSKRDGGGGWVAKYFSAENNSPDTLSVLASSGDADVAMLESTYRGLSVFSRYWI